MARKLLCTTLMSLVSLALLPGCQNLPFFARESAGDARSRQELATGQRSDEPQRLYTPPPIPRGLSTANERDPAVRVELPKPVNTSPEPGPVDVQPLAAMPPQGTAIDLLPPVETKNPSNLGTPGVSFVRSLQDEAKILMPASMQEKSLPLPHIRTEDAKQTEYAPFLKVLQLLLEKRDEKEALRHLQVYDKKTQDFFLELLPMLSILAITPIDELTPPQAALLNEQLYRLLVMLRPRSELGISKMCYCKRVNGFGHYVTLPDNYQFLAARDKPGEQVQVYVELKNFSSEPTSENDFLTKLVCGLELRDTTGKVVWSHTYDRKDTTARPKTRLNDFYRNFSFFVPPIPPGAYVLTVDIADETIPGMRRTTHKAMEFRVTPVSTQTSLR